MDLMCVENGRIVSSAAAWKFSDEAWDVAAVGTLEGFHGRGLAKEVVSFVTAYILENDRIAVTATGDDSVAMAATAKRVGFPRIPGDSVW